MLLRFARQCAGSGSERGREGKRSSYISPEITGMFLALLCVEVIYRFADAHKRGLAGKKGDLSDMRLKTISRLYALMLEKLYPPERKPKEEEKEEGEGGVQDGIFRRSAALCREMLAAAVGSALPICLPSERELGLFLNRHNLETLLSSAPLL
jgi:hypothetical protein